MLTLIARTMAPEAHLEAGPVVGLATLTGILAAIFWRLVTRGTAVERFFGSQGAVGRPHLSCGIMT